MRTFTTGLAIGSTFFAASAALAVDPTRIYLHHVGFGVDNTAQAYAAQQLGIADANGTIGSLEANGEVKIGGAVVGYQIKRDDGTLLGFKNAAGTQEMYNMNTISLNTSAFSRIANNGTIDVIAHGLLQVKEENGRRKEIRGGAFQRERRFYSAGFKLEGDDQGGTRVAVEGVSGTETIPAAQNRNFTLNLVSCYGGNDPDGDGPQRSVAASAARINRVTAVNSTQGVASISTKLDIVGGTDAQKNELFRKIKVVNRVKQQAYSEFQAREDGFGETTADQRAWLAFTRWWQRVDLFEHAVTQNFLVSGNAFLRATYTQDPLQRQGSADPFADPFSFSAPSVYTDRALVDPLTSDSFTLSFNRSTRGSAEVTIGPGDLDQPTYFHISIVPNPAALPAAPSSQPFAASGIFDFRGFEDDPSSQVAGELDYEFELFSEAGSDARIYFLGLGGWEPISSQVSDGRVFGSDSRIGIFAAFSSVPAPGPAAVSLLAGLTATRRRRR
jgi:hypothetical protein